MQQNKLANQISVQNDDNMLGIHRTNFEWEY